jgi:hypothetical protein
VGTWYEGLHRYSKIAREHADIKPKSDAIIAATERLYQYKTINYAKKQRVRDTKLITFVQRDRGTFLLDYEMNPPDIWGGIKQAEFHRVSIPLITPIEPFGYGHNS